MDFAPRAGDVDADKLTRGHNLLIGAFEKLKHVLRACLMPHPAFASDVMPILRRTVANAHDLDRVMNALHASFVKARLAYSRQWNEPPALDVAGISAPSYHFAIWQCVTTMRLSLENFAQAKCDSPVDRGFLRAVRFVNGRTELLPYRDATMDAWAHAVTNSEVELALAIEQAADVLPASNASELIERARRGRMPKDEAEHKRNDMLATLKQHPSMKDDPAALAGKINVSERTVRRWLDDEHEAYLNSIAARRSRDADE